MDYIIEEEVLGIPLLGLDSENESTDQLIELSSINSNVVDINIDKATYFISKMDQNSFDR